MQEVRLQQHATDRGWTQNTTPQQSQLAPRGLLEQDSDGCSRQLIAALQDDLVIGALEGAVVWRVYGSREVWVKSRQVRANMAPDHCHILIQHAGPVRYQRVLPPRSAPDLKQMRARGGGWDVVEANQVALRSQAG
jgi:hypothetical protein